MPAYPIANELQRRGIPFGFVTGVMATLIDPRGRTGHISQNRLGPRTFRQLVEALLPGTAT
jgi:hypothetical protein